ncbi:probable cytochrome P450 6a21 [Eurosta solidaginis]|uniref:probable cytochrome P450 6a21 n=1 Tax=Eurosta solidaginis TaxID=178769 RepID=UPI0035314836
MPLTEILFGALVILLAAAVYISRRNLNYWQQRGIPCDPPHFIFGNLKDVPKKISIAEVFRNIYKRYLGTGPFCGFYFLQKPSVLALSPEFTKRVLIKDFNNFVDRGFYSNEKDDPLTGHLFFLDGQKWRNLRNKLSPTFTAGQMRFMLPTVLAVADQLVDTLDSNLQKSDIIEIKEMLARFTTDVIGSCAFGIECNSLKNPDAIFRQMGRRLLTEERHSKFVRNLINALPGVARMLHMRIIKDEYTDFFMKIVRESVDYRAKNNVQRKDFLNILIELNKNAASDNSKGLSVEEMAAQVFVFFLAGFETSSTTLSFMLYELALNLNIQQRLRAEIMDALEKHNNEVTYECVNSMPYMKQVIAETLRKYPIVPQLQRVALSEYVVPEHPKYVIDKGTLIFIPVMAMYHNPEIYPEPEKFNPERFSPEEMQARDSINWLPFGDGPRNCIGLRFGQMQMRVALIYLLRNFEISTCHLTEIPLKLARELSLTNSKNGIQLKLQRTAAN